MISKTTLLAILILPVFSVFGQAGTLDPTYADNAEIKLLNFLPADEELLTHSITDSQDRTWIAGETFQNGDWRMILTRLDADGNYDTNFGGTGHAVLNLGGNNVEEVQGLALQGNDLVVAGKIVENGTSNPYLNEIHRRRIFGYRFWRQWDSCFFLGNECNGYDYRQQSKHLYHGCWV